MAGRLPCTAQETFCLCERKLRMVYNGSASMAHKAVAKIYVERLVLWNNRFDAWRSTVKIVSRLDTARQRKIRIASKVEIKRDNCGNSVMCMCVSFMARVVTIIINVPIAILQRS